ncbi:MAG: helix-turn-helix domain-containing protein [Lachnospiraceae bacterium]|nr:helix-turn-helix domain-containing protein [Lachnospiraceae bacterium]MDE7203206.1 helix-turn-helix domain-containing protein [Lachnospiraceae bacterium]
MRKNLKEARQKAGMTQQQIAEYLGITLRSYQRIEKGDFLGSICNWDALEDLFKVHQRELRLMTKEPPEVVEETDSC